MTRLIDADALLEEVKVIGNRPLPDVRTLKDLEQAIVNTYHAILNEITNAPTVQQSEPFGYFKAEPFGWTDCAETDEGAIALYEAPTVQREGFVSVPIEPTEEMKYQAVKEAGDIILQEVYPNGKYKKAVSLDSEMFGIAYKAMIQAAPTDKE